METSVIELQKQRSCCVPCYSEQSSADSLTKGKVDFVDPTDQNLVESQIKARNTEVQGMFDDLDITKKDLSVINDKYNLERRAKVLFCYVTDPRRTNLEVFLTLPVLQEYALMIKELPSYDQDLYRKISRLESAVLGVDRAKLETIFLEISRIVDRLRIPLSGTIYDYRNSMRVICFLRTADGLYQRFVPSLGKKYRDLTPEIEEARRRQDLIRKSLMSPPLPDGPENRVYNAVMGMLLGGLPVQNAVMLNDWFSGVSSPEREIFLTRVQKELVVVSDPVIIWWRS